MQYLALFVCLAYIFCLFFRDNSRQLPTSPGTWLVFLWVAIIGSRPVSTWLQSGLTSETVAAAYDEGNILERSVYFILLLAGLLILSRRSVRLLDVVRQNKWLALFFLYWLFSVFWADLPIVAFKRWVKDFGNVVMVFVILTDKYPIEAAKIAFLRCTYILIPISVLFIRYFSELGRTYHGPTGEILLTGVTTHKNSLGILTVVCGLFLIWSKFEYLRNKASRFKISTIIFDWSLVLMTLWLLIKSNSATSLACAFIGSALFLILKLPYLRSRIQMLGFYTIMGALFYFALNSLLNINSFLVENILQRDMTLTSRTEVWPALLEEADSPIFGSGFMSFWSGPRLVFLYDKYEIIQAHNGYLEVYLNGGWLAILLLIALLLSAFSDIKNDLLLGNNFGSVRLIFYILALIHNYTEASISKGGLIWFVLLLSIARWAPSTPSCYRNSVSDYER